jgi:hypothetical protein
VRDLQIVAVTSDGTHLVVADENGEQGRLAIDDRLRAAVRGDKVREGQLEISLASQLTPRDIQTRVRAGASVEEVAEMAGIPTERVLRFAAPVLDERTHMAAQATRALVRTEGQHEVGQLGPVVVGVLSGRGVADSLTWDAWRREDGRWLVESRWAEGDLQRSGLWLLDPAGRSVSALDEAARALAGLESPPAESAPPARLAVVRDAPPAAAATPAAPVEPEDETPTGPLPVVEPAAPAATSGASRPGRSRGGRQDPPADDRLWLTDIADAVEEEPARASGGGSSRKQRPSVPSWDEIMFGRRG